MNKLRTESFLETIRAPVYSITEVKKMFRKISADQRQYELMLISFMVAARIGHLHHLKNRGICEAGWRFTWGYHKTFYYRGAIDVVIPNKCIPEEIKHLMTTMPLGPVCTEEEQSELYSIMETVYHGRTYTIRRSALQHYKYTLKMSSREIIQISLHACEKSLERYLASPVDLE